MHEVNASAYRQKICGIVVLDCGLVFWHTHSRRCFFKLSGQVDWPVRNVKLLFTKLFSEAHPLPHFATSPTSSLLPGAETQTKTGRIRNVSGQTLISGPCCLCFIFYFYISFFFGALTLRRSLVPGT